MTAWPDPVAFFSQLLDRFEVAHAVIGGHAVNAWVEPRFTADVDFTVVADADALARVKRALGERGYRVALEEGADLPSGPDFIRLVAGTDDPPLDLQVAKTALQSEVIARASRRQGAPPIATPEDLIVLKLIAHRSKDLVDLTNLLALDGLDWPYVERWAREWEVDDVLSRLREG